MEMFGVILSLVVVGFVIAVTATSQKRSIVNAAWQAAASQRRLLFQPAQFFSGPEITGTLDGCQIRVDTATRGGDNSKKYTRFRVEYPYPLGLGLKLTEQGMMSGVKKLLGGQDIEVGDSWFDQAVVVKGSNAEQVVQFFSPARRQKVIAFFAEFPGAKIRDHEIRWEKAGVVEQSSGVLNPIGRMVELAQCFTREQEFVEEATDQVDDDQHEIVLEEPNEPPTPPPLEIMMQGGSEFAVIDIGEPPNEADYPLVNEPPADLEPVPLDHSEAADVEPTTVDAFDDPGVVEPVNLAQDVPKAPAIHADEAVPTVEPDAETTPESQLSAQTVAETLFGGSTMSHQVKEVFEETFRGHQVQWSGILKSVAHYPFDRVFGRTPGAKAVVEVHDAAGRTGRLSVKANIQLSTEAVAELRSKIGKPVAFEGELLACDGFMNSIFVGNGRVLWVGGA